MKRYSLHELLAEYVRRKWDEAQAARLRELRELLKFKSPIVFDYRPLPLGDWLSAGARRWLMMCWEERRCL